MLFLSSIIFIIFRKVILLYFNSDVDQTNVWWTYGIFQEVLVYRSGLCLLNK